MKKLIDCSLEALSSLLQKRELSAHEVTEFYLSATERAEKEISALITYTRHRALVTADKVDRLRAEGASLPALAGIPIVLKDNICTKGIRTTCASKMLEGFIPPYDAKVTELLALCPLIGKANMDEFGMGASTENSAFFKTCNPCDHDRVPGGSSGGSAAAVAAGEAPFALGSDTGGSVRQPAAFCGVVGLKPTYGLVSRFGLVAFASSLDQVAPLTKTVADSAIVLEAIAGHDSRDSSSAVRPPVSYRDCIGAGVHGKRIAVLRELSSDDCTPSMQLAFSHAILALEKEGASVLEYSIPDLRYALAAYYLLSSAEASSNLARYDGVRYGYRAEGCQSYEETVIKTRTLGFGSEVKRRLMLGTFSLSAGYADSYYKKALQARRMLKHAFDEAFTHFDLILAPTVLDVAHKFGEKQNPMDMYRGDIFTVPASLAGLPAISVPFGKDISGLPIGLQLIAPAFCEERLLSVAHVLESAGGLSV